MLDRKPGAQYQKGAFPEPNRTVPFMSPIRTEPGAPKPAGSAPAALLAALLWLAASGPAAGQGRDLDPEAAPDTAVGSAGDLAEEGERRGPSGLKLPRFVSLRADEVNMRTGPGMRYPIDWVYRRRDLPVEIIDEFDTWRRVRDAEGTAGWVHQSMLQGRRRVMVAAGDISLRRDPQDDSRPVALLQQGVIAELESCGGDWCVLEIESLKGWVKRSEVWGVYPDEDVN